MGAEHRRDEAFADWLEPHLAALRRISRAFAQPADQHDLLQELMVAVWRAWPRFEDRSSAATFVYRVAHNTALTWKRGEARRQRRSDAIEAELSLRLVIGDPAEAALLERLYRGVRTLPPLDRSLILLSLDGVAYGEIARLHGLSETNVGARLTRIRVRLSTLVKDDVDGV
ncbi:MULTISPECIES: RNA polymerase sigma factor [unclassified Caulobacter]|uniref:RNA polymerase sigma factor n=1 Tax=unclassified Caulobacter TaxID=2648921 RepID=UPI000D35C1E1|nr:MULTISPECIES: RNA polymerase sigma factor [unclassified Caulobacter]PTS88502.1 RNA polymerase sigma factor [Caulobacter sp. HMWF009]PTT09727.1 RNA polymerase sigma factor [Caulobacter sp. HMWF025]